MIQASRENTIKLLFEHAIDIEYKAAKIYERLSILFSHAQGLSEFWGELAEDEERHATTLKDVKKLLTPEQLLTQSDKKIWDSVAGIQRMLSQDLVGALQTLDDAYELAHELEYSETNAIFQFLATEFIPADKRQQHVVSEITQHQQKLLDFSRNFGDRNWRKGIKIQRTRQCTELEDNPEGSGSWVVKGSR